MAGQLDRPFAGFHPAVANWFSARLGEPTRAQRAGWDAIRQGRHTLIAAPTGSGKTLAAFLIALDDLLREGLAAGLDDEVRVVYVSPLKALSTDIHRNLSEPRAAICAGAAEMGLRAPAITAAVRTGDTPASARAAMLRKPPHILVTTPESLYLLLTSAASRDRLRHVRTVIVDEIHAVIGARRGAHLALSIERLASLCDRPPQRIGLSATQRPVEEVARFLVGSAEVDADGRSNCAVIDEGHRRDLDLAIEMPGSPLEAVMSHEVWEEHYDRLARAIGEHRTTLVFVEHSTDGGARHAPPGRAARRRSGGRASWQPVEGATARRRDPAEARRGEGRRRDGVARARHRHRPRRSRLSNRLASPHRDPPAARGPGWTHHSRHAQGTPLPGDPRRPRRVRRPAVAPCSAASSTAWCRTTRRSTCSHSRSWPRRRADDWHDDALFDAGAAGVALSWPVTRRVRRRRLHMLASGFTTRRGRRGALVHRDEVHGRLLGRRSARLTALTSGGAIPDNADYRVVLEPGRAVPGHAQRRLCHREHGRRCLPAGQQLVADSPGGLGRGAGRGRARRAADAAVLAGRGAGAKRRAVAVGQPPATRGRGTPRRGATADLTRSSHGQIDQIATTERTRLRSGRTRGARAAWLAGDTGMSSAAAEQIVGYLADSLRCSACSPP